MSLFIPSKVHLKMNQIIKLKVKPWINKSDHLWGLYWSQGYGFFSIARRPFTPHIVHISVFITRENLYRQKRSESQFKCLDSFIIKWKENENEMENKTTTPHHHRSPTPKTTTREFLNSWWWLDTFYTLLLLLFLFFYTFIFIHLTS